MEHKEKKTTLLSWIWSLRVGAELQYTTIMAADDP